MCDRTGSGRRVTAWSITSSRSWWFMGVLSVDERLTSCGDVRSLPASDSGTGDGPTGHVLRGAPNKDEHHPDRKANAPVATSVHDLKGSITNTGLMKCIQNRKSMIGWAKKIIWLPIVSMAAKGSRTGTKQPEVVALR